MRTLRELFARLASDGDARDKIRKFNLAPQVDGKARSIKRFAEALGFAVELRPLPRGVAGMLEFDAFSARRYCIVVNENESRERQRWTVLHELGHYFLHRDNGVPFADAEYRDRSQGAFYADQRKEREADAFAEIVLFGDGALEAAIGLCGKDLGLLARHFGVSTSVIEIAVRKFIFTPSTRSPSRG